LIPAGGLGNAVLGVKQFERTRLGLALTWTMFLLQAQALRSAGAPNRKKKTGFSAVHSVPERVMVMHCPILIAREFRAIQHLDLCAAKIDSGVVLSASKIRRPPAIFFFYPPGRNCDQTINDKEDNRFQTPSRISRPQRRPGFNTRINVKKADVLSHHQDGPS